jgi:hypothetical protein
MSTQESGITAGQSATAIVDPAAEATYWSENHLKRTYVLPTKRYSDYEPAFRHGWESRALSANRPFREIEADLERAWDKVKGASSLTWVQARFAVSDAWHRAGRPAEVEPTTDAV